MDGKLYTRRGDKGETSLAGGGRVRKDDPRIEAYGELDEAISLIGVARSETGDPALLAALEFAQQRLMNATAYVEGTAGQPGAPGAVTGDDVAWLEDATDRLQEDGPAFSAFVLPGGSRTSALLDAARTSVRRAERRLCALPDAGPSDDDLHAFMNRLSDMLFAAARYAAALDGVEETLWDPKARPPEL